MKMFVAFVVATVFIAVCFFIVDSHFAQNPAVRLAQNPSTEKKRQSKPEENNPGAKKSSDQEKCTLLFITNPNTFPVEQECFQVEVSIAKPFSDHFEIILPIEVSVVLTWGVCCWISELIMDLRYKTANKYYPRLNWIDSRGRIYALRDQRTYALAPSLARMYFTNLPYAISDIAKVREHPPRFFIVLTEEREVRRMTGY